MLDAIAHLQGVAVKAKGAGQVLFLTHRPCVYVLRAARSKTQDQKRARVHTECGEGAKHMALLWLPPMGTLGRHMGPQRRLALPSPPSKSWYP